MDEPVQTPSLNPLPVEETPVIESIPQIVSPPPPIEAPKPVKKHSGSCLKTLGIIVLIILLFIGGVWLSSVIRQFIPTGAPGAVVEPEETPAPTNPADPYAAWLTYDATSGVTYKLPPDMLAPICDGPSCISQGTYLPGGTRLTIAMRGDGQALRDYRGSIISDANGIPIPTKEMVLGNYSVTEYESSVSGRTISGYTFSQIRGVMIPLTNTLSIEVNHFAPVGIEADFEADDELFNLIIKTVTSTEIQPTTTPTVATSSGY